MNAPLDRDFIVVVGQQGMGKTLWTRGFLRTRPRVIILDPIDEYHGKMFDEDFDELADHIADNRIFQVRTNRDDWLPHIAKLARAKPDTTLVIEEASRVLPPWRDIKSEVPEMLDVIYRGRHTGTSLILVAQRAATINIQARSQFTRLITFRQVEMADVRWIQNVSSVGDDLTTLAPLHYYDVGLTETMKKVLPRPGRKGVTP